MRKHQQEKILNLLQTLDEALDELYKQSDEKVIANLLTDCQDFIIQITRYIEMLAGEETKTATLLNEYYELLFKASTGEIKEKVLRKLLIKISNSVRSELIPNKIEIAFLSYNASMSDSILSIYQAANADSNCDAYWIPIPYFERTEEIEFGEMHYEGQEYYLNIKCTDWREYDIEERRPDIIFTFYPYDSTNYVTNIHPDFYCERLRKLTDLLIYVPYFVSMDYIHEYFVTLPGCIYAHKVIVQSENLWDSYVRIFKDSFGNKFGKPEDKFLALGSPKFDAVNAQRKDCELPEQWRKLINGKKIILYNTTVGPIVNENEQYINKLRSVFDVFLKRSDVALWWRPHPLSFATYSSMRPHLLGEFKQLVADYNHGSWGIYDNTPDLYRAIAMTDGYYGDVSSVAFLYQATGKPIVFAENNLFQNSSEFLDTVTEDDEIYSVLESGKLNLETFCNYVVSGKLSVKNPVEVSNNVGKAIYDYVNNLISE